jgi:hypothetical protein
MKGIKYESEKHRYKVQGKRKIHGTEVVHKSSGDRRQDVTQKYNDQKRDSNQAGTPSPLPTHRCKQSLSTLKAAL